MKMFDTERDFIMDQEAAVTHRIVVGAIARRAHFWFFIRSSIVKTLASYDDGI